jgi:hypothetical protein
MTDFSNRIYGNNRRRRIVIELSFEDGTETGRRPGDGIEKIDAPAEQQAWKVVMSFQASIISKSRGAGD